MEMCRRKVSWCLSFGHKYACNLADPKWQGTTHYQCNVSDSQPTLCCGRIFFIKEQRVDLIPGWHVLFRSFFMSRCAHCQRAHHFKKHKQRYRDCIRQSHHVSIQPADWREQKDGYQMKILPCNGNTLLSLSDAWACMVVTGAIFHVSNHFIRYA